MGHIFANIEIEGGKGKERLEKVLVDTGATYSFLPKETLEKIGAFKHPRTKEIELGNGERLDADVYTLDITINERTGPAAALTFEGAKSVVGVEALESLGLKVDPSSEKLESTRPKGLAYFYSLSKLNEVTKK
ncbi:MAG: hypothetical protein L6243_07125 [Candidatus Altiarchaeales archaeon]|nr:hypothetical protein [Candidatus Altiarchaeota archaeon]MCG2783343.1 hypothetical protein [Candidatus Altiarchaeales archaeon]